MAIQKLSFFLLFISVALFGGEARMQFLKERCDKILAQMDPSTQISIKVISLQTKEILYEHNSQLRMIPASTAKIYTVAAALDQLGPDYTFETELLMRGKIDGGTLKGTLYLKGSGDPSFKEKDLRLMIESLASQGVNRIEGTLAIDGSAFDEIAYGPGWMWDDMPTSWCPPLAGLNINHGLITILVQSQGKIGQPPTLVLGSTDEKLRIDNRAQIGEKNGDFTLKRQLAMEGQPIEVSGTLKKSAVPLKCKIPVIHPLPHAAHIAFQLLKEKGIEFKGRISLEKTPGSARLVASHTSRPLKDLAKKMLKESDNFYADAFFKKMGQKRNQVVGTWSSGSQAVRDFLTQRVGLSSDQMILLDGSGLSRYNLTTSEQLVSLLEWVDQRAPFKEEFKSSLAVAGIDGSLKERLGAPRTKGQVFAKTGSMTGVSALCGYLTTKDKEPLAFAIISNGFVSSCRDIRAKLEDPLVSEWMTLPRPR